MKKEKRVKRKKRKSIIFIRILMMIYVMGVMTFTVFTNPRNIVNGERVGFKGVSSFKKNIATGEKIVVKGQDGFKVTIPVNEINYIASIDSSTPYKQSALLWPKEIVNPENQELKLNISYNYGKLREFLVDADNTTMDKEPVDAEIYFDEKANEYKIKKEEYGSYISIDNAVDIVTQSLDSGKFKEISILEGYAAPNIKSTDEYIVRKKDNLNKIKDIKITYDFMYTKEELSGESLIEMYKDNAGNLEADEEAAEQYLIDLAIKYDTFGSDRKFKAKDIGEIIVPGGIYGWEISVKESLPVLVDALNSFESRELTPEYRIEGVYRDEYNDIGPTYVEVDIGRQHMWYFKDGEMVFDAPFVSGKDVDGRRTPLGVNQLWSKQRDTYLTGETWNTHVDYWMPIDWSGVGFHDAKWRGSFGGEIYKTNGSHGCLNMQAGQASEFYNMVELYTPVVVYDSTKL